MGWRPVACLGHGQWNVNCKRILGLTDNNENEKHKRLFGPAGLNLSLLVRTSSLRFNSVQFLRSRSKNYNFLKACAVLVCTWKGIWNVKVRMQNDDI
jgi:hypothetical protein